MAKRTLLTTDSGMPIADNQNSITAGPRGPLLMQDFHLLEKLAHQNRERIPERTVHAKGSAAYGTLTVTPGDERHRPHVLNGDLDTVQKQADALARAYPPAAKAIAEQEAAKKKQQPTGPNAQQ